MNVILRLFPARWRTRYGDEFLALLEDQPPGRRRWPQIARCLIAAHLDRSAPPSLEPTPPGARALVVAILILGAASATLGVAFVSGASYSALRKAADLLAPLLIIGPLAVVVAVGLAVRRDADRPLRAALPDAVADAFLFAVIGLLAVATLSPQLGFFDLPARLELRPFHDLLTASSEVGRSQAIAIIAGNALLFTVLGFALALRRGRPGFLRVMAIASGLAITLEAGQALLGTGRSSDVTDVAVRLIGAAIGYAVWQLPRALISRPAWEPPTGAGSE